MTPHLLTPKTTLRPIGTPIGEKTGLSALMKRDARVKLIMEEKYN